MQKRVLAGLNIAVENQVLSGDGLSANVLGILLTSGILTQAAVGTDLFATTRSAVTSLEALGHAPSMWVFSPVDWQRFDLAREHQRPVRSA